ncbi:MAG: hypothetical protein JWO07_864 [Candidatus Saccharibacteria bacterium]|nr:hypothetical protein [Candidatus Saccharibacteria bacterium]
MENQDPQKDLHAVPQIPTLDAVQAPSANTAVVTANTVTESVVPVADDAPSLFSQIAEKIIEQQEAIIGPIAVEQAKQIRELAINWPKHDVGITGSPQDAIDDLVEKYKELFGQIAVQVSREASASFLAQLPVDQRPKSLTE